MRHFESISSVGGVGRGDGEGWPVLKDYSTVVPKGLLTGGGVPTVAIADARERTSVGGDEANSGNSKAVVFHTRVVMDLKNGSTVLPNSRISL
jgi:hypothetical protein